MKGFYLKQLRQAKKLNQREVADALGIAISTLSQWETNKREPDNQSLQKLADYFGVSTDYLLGRTDDPGQKTEPAPQNESERLDAEFAQKFNLLSESEKQAIAAMIDVVLQRKK